MFKKIEAHIHTNGGELIAFGEQSFADIGEVEAVVGEYLDTASFDEWFFPMHRVIADAKKCAETMTPLPDELSPLVRSAVVFFLAFHLKLHPEQIGDEKVDISVIELDQKYGNANV